MSSPRTLGGASAGDRGRAEQVGPVRAAHACPQPLLEWEGGVCSVNPGSGVPWMRAGPSAPLSPPQPTFPEPSQAGAPWSFAALSTWEVEKHLCKAEQMGASQQRVASEGPCI